MIKSKHKICTICGKVKSWMKEPGPCWECYNKELRKVAKEFYTECPSCGKKIYYKYATGVCKARKTGGNYCLQCGRYSVLAKGTGMTIQEIIKQIPAFRRYANEVRRLTRHQPLHILENYEKRGRYSYHIDHIISIWNGFLNNRPPEKIADISNLQMLWWKDNLRKSWK